MNRPRSNFLYLTRECSLDKRRSGVSAGHASVSSFIRTAVAMCRSAFQPAWRTPFTAGRQCCRLVASPAMDWSFQCGSGGGHGQGTGAYAVRRFDGTRGSGWPSFQQIGDATTLRLV